MAGKPVIAVALSGCGVFDGSEIHESVLSLLAIERLGARARCFAPNIPQSSVVNHLTGQVADEGRNVLVESARIARGEIEDLARFNAAECDAILLPGGFGAAKNLSDFAEKGAAATLEPSLLAALLAMRAAQKPIGALCISPAILACAIKGATVTIGKDEATAAQIEKAGGHHRPADHGEAVVDQENRIVTAPCYMLPSTLEEIAKDAECVVRELLRLMR